jgi:hypothetical protein
MTSNRVHRVNGSFSQVHYTSHSRQLTAHIAGRLPENPSPLSKMLPAARVQHRFAGAVDEIGLVLYR